MRDRWRVPTALLPSEDEEVPGVEVDAGPLEGSDALIAAAIEQMAAKWKSMRDRWRVPTPHDECAVEVDAGLLEGSDVSFMRLQPTMPASGSRCGTA